MVMTQIALIKLSLDGVRFKAEADFGGRMVAVKEDTAHGALHKLAGQVEQIAAGNIDAVHAIAMIRAEVENERNGRPAAFEASRKILEILDAMNARREV
jgi:hypothetical protein